MDDQITRHQMVVTSFIKSKLEEFEYFLIQILEICQLVNSNFVAGINPVDTSGKNINFVFNAWTNTFQSLKDSLSIAVASDIAWSRFSDVRHSEFIKVCRNAMTHDGMQVIDAYADGKYYIAGDIERFDNKKNFIKIVPPKEDIRTLCVQFSNDLMKVMDEIIVELEGRIPKEGVSLKFEEVERFINDSSFIPEHVKDIFRQNCGNVESALQGQKVGRDFVAEIRKKILNIQVICRNS